MKKMVLTLLSVLPLSSISMAAKVGLKDRDLFSGNPYSNPIFMEPSPRSSSVTSTPHVTPDLERTPDDVLRISPTEVTANPWVPRVRPLQPVLSTQKTEELTLIEVNGEYFKIRKARKTEVETYMRENKFKNVKDLYQFLEELDESKGYVGGAPSS